MNDSPQHTPVNDEAIEAMAAAWLVQRDEGFSAEQAAEFARWQKADPRHAAAVAMLEETCGILETLPQIRAKLGHIEPIARDESMPAAPAPAKVIRFPKVLKFAAAIAACFAVALVAWKLRPAREAVMFANTYSTATLGYQRVVLPDQSVVELNANTEVRVAFTHHRRDVMLARGEAHFTVAKNPARPFVVGASHITVRAVGTAFNVRFAPATIDVLVTEGHVEVRNVNATGATTPDPALQLVAGQRARVATGDAAHFAPTVTSVDSAAMREALEWQSAPLIWLDAPLGDVVQQFNQRNRIQLAIEDADLARRKVGGTIRADQVETFVALLEKSGDIAVEHRDAEHIVLRKTR